MSLPIRNLPVMQNWDCHSCADCCRLVVTISAEEKRRIEALDLANDPEIAPKPWFAPAARGSQKWTLTQRPGGGCVFLTNANRCGLHERFGADAKPFACRVFPFVLIPAGDHWRVGMRYSCPSAAANRGRPVADAEADLMNLSSLLEQHSGKSAESAQPPLLKAGQQLSWSDVCRVVQALVKIVQNRRDRLERRLRKCLAVARVCEQAQLDKLGGSRLSEFLQIVTAGVETEVPREAADLPPPDPLLGTAVFRFLLAIFARRDRELYWASGLRRSSRRVLAAWRFVRGRGPVPGINEFLPDTTFEEVERRNNVLPEIDATLERYYVVKLNSLQFCGPTNFNLPLWSGLESLVLTLPMILWLGRAFTGLSPVDAVQQAIQLVDDHFGANRSLGLPHIRFLMRTLAERGELEKLVAWYSR
jgi:lysine-N-methylase